jgi:hypothetical protein
MISGLHFANETAKRHVMEGYSGALRHLFFGLIKDDELNLPSQVRSFLL